MSARGRGPWRVGQSRESCEMANQKQQTSMGWAIEASVNWIKKNFASPVFADNPDKTIKAGQVNIILNWSIAGMLIFALLNLIVRPSNMLLAELELLVVVAILYGLSRLNYSGQVRLASWLLILFVSIAQNMSVINTGGIRAAGYSANIVVIIIVGMLLGMRAALAYVAVILLLGLGLIQAQSNGLLHTDPNNTSIAIWAYLTFCFLLSVGLLQVAISGIRRALNEARRELAERKRVEQEHEKLIKVLEHRNAELERFAYTLSHELKSPLITIKGFLGYLYQDALAGDTIHLKTDFQRISDGTEKMHRLINELLELLSVGQILNPFEEVSFRELVDEAIALLDGTITDGNVALHVADDFPIIYADRQRLVEVLQNLVENSVKFMGDQPKPCIEIGHQQRKDKFTVFFVRDNGIGIEQRFKDRIFDIFSKLDAKSDGTGIGLALVKRIIEMHGGKIWVESEGSSKGSTFYFTLPDARQVRN